MNASAPLQAEETEQLLTGVASLTATLTLGPDESSMTFGAPKTPLSSPAGAASPAETVGATELPRGPPAAAAGSAPAPLARGPSPSPAPLPLNVTLQLAKAVEGVLGRLTAGLVGSAAMNSSSANETRVVTIQAGGISLTAASIPVTVQREGQDTTAPPPPPGLPLARGLPSTALSAAATAVLGANSTGSAQIGVQSCRWKALNPYGPATVGTGTSRKVVQPAGDVISLSLTTSDGKPVVVQNLTTPIILALPISMVNRTQDDLEEQLVRDGSFPECRWWDKASQSWKGSGCRTMGLRNNGLELLCSCTHLTTFGSFNSPIDQFNKEFANFWEGLVNVIIYCASAGTLLSAAGIAALQDSAWVNQACASAFFILLLLFGGGLVASAIRDIHDKEEHGEVWQSLAHVRWFDLMRLLQEYWDFLSHPKAWRSTFIRSMINLHTSFHLGVTQASLDILEEAQRAPEGLKLPINGIQQRGKWSFYLTIAKASRGIELQRDAVIDDFSFRDLRACEGMATWAWVFHLLRRFAKLCTFTFIAAHPFAVPALADLDSLVSHRTLVLAVQMLGSIFCTALYFNASGSASARWSPDECHIIDTVSRVRLAIPVAFVSTLVAVIPSSILNNLIGARPCPEKQNGKKISVGLSYSVFYFLGLSMCGFYMMFVAAFLANVHQSSAVTWVISASCSVFSTILVMPLIQAIISAGAVSIFLWRTPALLATNFHLKFIEEGQAAEGAKGGPVATKLILVGAARDRQCPSSLPESSFPFPERSSSSTPGLSQHGDVEGIDFDTPWAAERSQDEEPEGQTLPGQVHGPESRFTAVLPAY